MVAPAVERVAWVAGEDLTGPPGSEFFFLARNSQGLGSRIRRGFAIAGGRAVAFLLGPWGRKLALCWGAWVLRRTSRDRLTILGEEYFESSIRPRIRKDHELKVEALRRSGKRVVLVTHALECVAEPLARHLGIEEVCANVLEFRRDLSTGRVVPPIVLVRGSRCANLAALSSRPVNEPARRPVCVVDRPVPPPELSVVSAYEGKTVLVVGVTGFIGKVFVAKLLHDLPKLGRVFLLVRSRGQTTARERVRQILEQSPVFDVVRDRFGDRAEEYLQEKIVVVDGDVTRPNLGTDASFAAELAESVDLLVNCAGLTEFNPDLRDALATNVDSSSHLVQFLRNSKRAALLHVSTCFVAGSRAGRIVEDLDPSATPKPDRRIDAVEEARTLHSMVAEETARAQSRLERSSAARSRHLQNRLIDLALSRAHDFGWPNIYTYTKALGESLLHVEGAGLPLCIVRPSIVESARSFPFPGWNEGINTSAPLSYVLGTWFRQLPVRRKKCLDVIPVDDVVRGMVLVGAALLERRAPRVAQLATSVSHPLEMHRSVELTALAHRRHYVKSDGWKSWALARLEAIPVSRKRYERWSIPKQAAILRWWNRLFSGRAKGTTSLQRAEKNLARVKKLIELYEPFILGDEHVFEAVEVERLQACLPPREEETFGYNVRSLDWAHYWTSIHIPGLRRWTYPLIEGRTPKSRVRRSPAATEAPAVSQNLRRSDEAAFEPRRGGA